MTPRQYWNDYVKSHGGAARVAERLGIPFPTIASVCNGRRGIGRALATRMVASDRKLDREILIWVEAIPAANGVLPIAATPKKKGPRRAA